MNGDTTPQRLPRSLPLSVVFEGRSWKLTTLLHTTIAIWLVVLINDQDRFLYVPFKRGNWTDELLRYLAAMFASFFQTALAIGVLSPNRTPTDSKRWRRRQCLSGFALFLIDIMAWDYMVYAIEKILFRTNDLASIPATAFISFVGTVLAILFNVLYVRLFGCCACCCCQCCRCCCPCCHSLRNDSAISSQSDEGQEDREDQCQVPSDHQQNSSPRDSTSHATTESPLDDQVMSHRGHSQAEPMTSGSQPTEMEWVTEVARSTCDFMQTIPSTSSVVATSVEELRMRDRKEIQAEAPPVVLTVPSVNNAIRGTPQQAPNPQRILRRMDTIQLVELGSRSLHNKATHTRGFSRDCEIIEEEPQTTAEVRRTTRRPSTIPNVSSIVRRFLLRDDSEDSSIWWWSPRDIWNALREESGRFRYAVWIKSAFLTSVIVLVYTHIRTLSIIHHLTDLYTENREKFNSNLDGFEECLVDAGWSNGFNSINNTAVVKIYHLVDAIMLDLKSTAFVGYMLGTAVGLRSLVTVLIQHKRMSLAISEGLREFRHQTLQMDQEESPWLDFQKKYPILDACVFLAVLCSTAVVQLHIIGILSSILLGLIVNYSESSVLMDEFGYYILAYFLVFVIEKVMMHFLKTWLISSDGADIRRPRWFNFFIVVLSMVNLVLGLFFVLWRLIYLLLTTIAILNRLDITLFASGKRLDNGHNAFMSMLVLTVLVQEDHDSFAAQSKQKPSVQSNET